MKRGQVTVFIVLGVLIILGLIFLTYIVTTKNKDTLQKTQEDVVVTSLEKADVSQYVTGCLDEALRTGIVLIGAQGGFIFPDQEYSMIPYALPSYQYNDSAGSYRVASLIQQSVLFPLAPVPLYPCYVTYSTANESNRKIMGDQCMKFYYDHKRTDFRFGNYVSDPSGKRINPGLCSSRIDDPAHSYLCDCKAGGDCTYSIQKQLEYYVTSYVKQCVDFDTFKQTVGYNVKTGNIIANVSFSDADTSVFLTYPINRVDDEGRRSLKDFSFVSSVPVRLKTLYGLVHGTQYSSLKSDLSLGSVEITDGIVDLDLNSVTYNVVSDTLRLFNQAGIAGVTLSIKQVGEGSIISLIDEKSSMQGKPFTFSFYRQNRPPALDRFRTRASEDYDVIAYEGDELFFAPQAFDPDEEPLTYHYSGWKVDYDEVWNDAKRHSEQIPLSNNLWETGAEYRFGEHCPNFYTSQPDVARCASIKVNRSDIGPHQLTLTVTDSFGNKDYETLRILVQDLPEVIFNVTHLYGEQIPTYRRGVGFIVSKEDPLYFDAKESTVMVQLVPGNIAFRWIDHQLNEEETNQFNPFPLTTLSDQVAFPFIDKQNKITELHTFVQQADEVTDLYNIEAYGDIDFLEYANRQDLPEVKAEQELASSTALFNISKRLGYFDSEEEKHTIEMKLVSSQGKVLDYRKEDIYEAECLPYRSNVSAYPFNTLPQRAYGRSTQDVEQNFNPYMTNHTCCVIEGEDQNPSTSNPENWKIAPEGTPCFPMLKDIRYTDDLIENQTFFKNNYYPIMDLFEKSIFSNASLQREYLTAEWKVWGECDGQRGNICVPKTELIPDIRRLPPVPPPSQPSPQCNDGHVYIGVWIDINGDGQKDQTRPSRYISAYEGSVSAKENYGYGQSAPHIQTGPQANVPATNLFFYKGSDGLHFYVTHGTNPATSSDTSLRWEFVVTGNTVNEQVVFSDDSDQDGVDDGIPDCDDSQPNHLQSRNCQELYETNPGVFDGTWKYQSAGDGGVIGSLDGTGWQINTQLLLGVGVETKIWSGNGYSVKLSDITPVNNIIVGYYDPCAVPPQPPGPQYPNVCRGSNLQRPVSQLRQTMDCELLTDPLYPVDVEPFKRGFFCPPATSLFGNSPSPPAPTGNSILPMPSPGPSPGPNPYPYPTPSPSPNPSPWLTPTPTYPSGPVVSCSVPSGLDDAVYNCNAYDMCCRLIWQQTTMEEVNQYGWQSSVQVYAPQAGKSCARICYDNSKVCVGVGKPSEMNCAIIINHYNHYGVCGQYTCDWETNCDIGSCFDNNPCTNSGCQFDSAGICTELRVGGTACFCQDAADVTSI